MHNAGYAAIGANFIYLPIATDDIKNAIAGVRGLHIRGTSISMPHKQTVMQYLDTIDPIAQTIGAVNTISNDNGVLTGYNSDWIGAVAALKEVTALEDKKVIVIGAGGAARAIIYGLVQNKAKVIVYDRTFEKARSLTENFGAAYGGTIEDLRSVSDYDIVINATSVGFGTNASIVNEAFFRPQTIAMDVIVMPAETAFLKLAKAGGAHPIAGSRMLIHQAIFQIELFSGKKAPFEVMEKALLGAQ